MTAPFIGSDTNSKYRREYGKPERARRLHGSFILNAGIGFGANDKNAGSGGIEPRVPF